MAEIKFLDAVLVACLVSLSAIGSRVLQAIPETGIAEWLVEKGGFLGLLLVIAFLLYHRLQEREKQIQELQKKMLEEKEAEIRDLRSQIRGR